MKCVCRRWLEAVKGGKTKSEAQIARKMQCYQKCLFFFFFLLDCLSKCLKAWLRQISTEHWGFCEHDLHQFIENGPKWHICIPGSGTLWCMGVDAIHKFLQKGASSYSLGRTACGSSLRILSKDLGIQNILCKLLHSQEKTKLSVFRFCTLKIIIIIIWVILSRWRWVPIPVVQLDYP